ncbi:MAG: pilus assembly PilX family protein [Desulfoprunum sp.]
MKHIRTTMENDRGYVLVVALLIMAILSLIGVAGMNTSIFETQVAGNEWNAKRTLYRADGGVTLGAELVEQNLGCEGIGFKSTLINDTVMISNKLLSFNGLATDDDIVTKINAPATSYDAAFSATGKLTKDDIGYLFFGGETTPLVGSGMEFGTAILGVSASQGGYGKLYEIHSQYLGTKNSESIIESGWIHIVGKEGSCIF